jgi:beta-glucosidase
MPWASSANAIMHAWYGGNETGNAIADVLYGQVNPSGKLPLSFPIRVEDNPAFLNFGSERGRTIYGEDVYVGYRFYEKTKKDVLFPFGHGLSYTSFVTGNLALSLSPADDTLTVVVNVHNTGSRRGSQVIQVYVAQHHPSISRPVKELKGFSKVHLDVDEKREVRIPMSLKYATSFWDESRRAWIMEKDAFDVLVGSSSVDEDMLKTSFDIDETVWWNGL